MRLILLGIVFLFIACGNDGNGSNNQIGSGNTVNQIINNTTIVQANAQGNIDVSTVQKTPDAQDVSSSEVSSVSSFSQESSNGETGTFEQNGVTYNYYQTDSEIYYWTRNEEGNCITIHQKNGQETVYIYACSEVGQALENDQQVYKIENNQGYYCTFSEGQLTDCTADEQFESIANNTEDPNTEDPNTENLLY
jgi:hypothetical protein